MKKDINKNYDTMATKYSYLKTNFKSDKCSVYRKGRLLITPDCTEHNGKYIKVAYNVKHFKNPNKRLGTYTWDLKIRIKD